MLPIPQRIMIGLASLFFAALLLFLFLPRNPGAFRSVPAQSSLVLECKGLLRAKLQCNKSTDSRWHEVFQSDLFDQCFADADAALQVFNHDPQMLRAFAQNKSLVAFSLHAADSLHALFVIELTDDFDLEKGLKSQSPTLKYFPHQFHGNDIFSIRRAGSAQMEMAVTEGLLLFSTKATLVEDALAQLESPHNWWSDRPLIDQLPDATLRLHLRPAALAEQWRGQMNPRWRGLPDLLARNLEWIGLSWDGSRLQTLAEIKGFLSQWNAWGKSEGSGVAGVLPDNTAFIAQARLGNIPEFFRLIGTGRTSDFEQFILPWVGDEVALAVTEPLSPGLVGDRLLVLSVRDSLQAMESLRAFAKTRGAAPGAGDPYQMFEVFGFQNTSLLRPVLGEDEAFRNPACALLGHYLVIAPDRSSLEILLDKYLVNQTLSANIDFLQLQQKRLPGTPVSFVLNTAFLPAIWQNIRSDEEGGTPLAKAGFMAAELRPGRRGGAEFVLSVQALTQATSETDILWKTVLQAPVITSPCVIALPDGKVVVLVQDLKYRLYCLDAQNGGLIWTKNLTDRILSDPQGIDFFSNGSLCYTFSSSSQLYVLDEQGRDVQGFPFKLPATASNAATVTDFDKNARFNYFVACDNGKIYGFGASGKPLDAWNAVPSKGTVKAPILHFQFKGKDYLAVLTEQGLLSVYGRDGTLRFSPLQLPGKFLGPLTADPAAAAPHIYTANTEGKLFACDLEGKLSTQTQGKAGSVAAFGQLTGDAGFEWAVLEDKKLTVGSWKTGALFSTQFPEKQHRLFFAENEGIGTVDLRGRRICLLDKNGKIAPGFPLGGNTPFSFFQQNGVNRLVAGNGNGVWAYRVKQ